jgi:hypothetical protein
MAKIKLQNEMEGQEKVIPVTDNTLENIVLETRKVKALEKIANSLDALTIWFEEVNKDEWSDRIAYYLYEFYNIAKSSSTTTTTEMPEFISAESGELQPPARKIRPKKDIETV